MQEHREEERNRPFDLPMGGLLSELLASEGIDAGEIAAVETPAAGQPYSVRPESPPSPAPSNPDEPSIALPGLLSDLLSLAGATGSAEPAPAAGSLPPQPGESPGLPGSEPHQASPVLGAESIQDNAPVEPPMLAIPGLLSLLTADPEAPPESAFLPESAQADETPAAEDLGSATHEQVCEESLPASSELDIGGASGPPPAMPFEETVEESAVAGQESLTERPLTCAEPNAPENPVTESPALLAEPEGSVLAGSTSKLIEPAGEAGPEYSPADAAAALAEAAGQLVMEASARSGESPQRALADLMGAIGAASPANPAEQPPAPPESCERYIVFQLGEQSCGLHITCVREVEKVGRVTPVPGAPPMIRGLINLHGEILPLIDPRPLLGMPDSKDASGNYLVVVHRGDQLGSVAWQVDSLGGMALVDPDRVSSARQGERPVAHNAGIATGWASHRGRGLLLLDSRLTSEESVEQAAGGWTVQPEVGL